MTYVREREKSACEKEIREFYVQYRDSFSKGEDLMFFFFFFLRQGYSFYFFPFVLEKAQNRCSNFHLENVYFATRNASGYPLNYEGIHLHF